MANVNKNIQMERIKIKIEFKRKEIMNLQKKRKIITEHIDYNNYFKICPQIIY